MKLLLLQRIDSGVADPPQVFVNPLDAGAAMEAQAQASRHPMVYDEHGERLRRATLAAVSHGTTEYLADPSGERTLLLWTVDFLPTVQQTAALVREVSNAS